MSNVFASKTLKPLTPAQATQAAAAPLNAAAPATPIQTAQPVPAQTLLSKPAVAPTPTPVSQPVTTPQPKSAPVQIATTPATGQGKSRVTATIHTFPWTGLPFDNIQVESEGDADDLIGSVLDIYGKLNDAFSGGIIATHPYYTRGSDPRTGTFQVPGVQNAAPAARTGGWTKNQAGSQARSNYPRRGGQGGGFRTPAPGQQPSENQAYRLDQITTQLGIDVPRDPVTGAYLDGWHDILQANIAAVR